VKGLEDLLCRLRDAEFEQQDETRRLLSEEYLRRIQEQLPQQKPSSPFLLGVIGLIGAGKTTTLRYIEQRVPGSVMVRTDAARFLLKESEIADENDWPKYAPIASDIAFNVQRCILTSGYTVLFDRDFVEASKQQQAQRDADAVGVPFHLIRIDLHRDLSLQRLEKEWERVEIGERKQNFDHFLVVTRGKEAAVYRRGKLHEELDSQDVPQLIGRLDNRGDKATLEAQIDAILTKVLPH
jgi:predicted kinase